MCAQTLSLNLLVESFRAGDGSRRKTHVEVGRAANEGQDPCCDRELERQVVLVAEPELEPGAEREDERSARRGDVAHVPAEPDATGERERRCRLPALVGCDAGADLDVGAAWEPDPWQRAVGTSRERAQDPAARGDEPGGRALPDDRNR